MHSFFFKPLIKAIKHWSIPLLVGIFFIIVSIIVFTSHGNSHFTLGLFFAISFYLEGFLKILADFRERYKQLQNNIMNEWHNS